MMQSSGRRVAVGVVVSLAVALLLVPGCSRGTTQVPKKASPAKAAEQTAPAKTQNQIETALAGLRVARSSATSEAPDARLLVASTSDRTAPGAVPTWNYFFGSPSKGKTYLIVVAHGTSMPAQEVNDTGYSTGELSKVPDATAWKIDSDIAYAKAFAASGFKAKPAAYTMGLETYQAQSDTSTVRPFVWRVRLFPADGSASTTTIDVNATTGVVLTAK